MTRRPPPPDALPSFRLDGQVALITGASRGIGRGLVDALAAAGATVAAGVRSDAALDDLAATGSAVVPYHLDVTVCSRSYRTTSRPSSTPSAASRIRCSHSPSTTEPGTRTIERGTRAELIQRITLAVSLARDLHLRWSAHRWDLIN